MKVRFIGSPNSADAGKTCEMFGKLFVVGHDVDVSDLPAAQQRKLASNHHFVVAAKEAKKEEKAETSAFQHDIPPSAQEPAPAKRGPGRPRKVIADGGDDQNAG